MDQRVTSGNLENISGSYAGQHGDTLGLPGDSGEVTENSQEWRHCIPS